MATRNMYEVEVSHEGLNKYRHIRGSDRYIVEQKAQAQLNAWNEMWEKKQDIQRRKDEREAVLKSKEEKKLLAIEKTEEAEDIVLGLQETLLHTLDVDDTVNWSLLINRIRFTEPAPRRPKQPAPLEEPDKTAEKYQPKITIIDILFKKFRMKKEAEADLIYQGDFKKWRAGEIYREDQYKQKLERFTKDTKAWEQRKNKYDLERKVSNQKIGLLKKQYMDSDPKAIEDYCELVLSNSKYPDFFPQQWDIEYIAESKIIVIDYSLPDKNQLPRTKAVKYVATRDDFTETKLSDAFINKLYDSLLYQIALRTIHELYEADVVNGLESIVFNGWVDSVDKATGKNVNSCIMSLQASKDEFLDINLYGVDPKICFKQLKGVGSSKLHAISPVAPILNINKEDRRFISAYDVVDSVDATDNLAIMDWQDFENLIREIFEKEFMSNGGEVKITKASKDGGVDAVAFDPDPIRGGKIVIQAKRYSNTVGVSAVRDLYGTTMNEGATKGILVTTADYGPDAYDFAKGKPLTLLNGGNLLHLLDKHGHKAKIDLKEAKLHFAEQKI